VGCSAGRERQRVEGKRKDEGKKRKVGDKKRRSGLSPSKKHPEGTDASIYY